MFSYIKKAVSMVFGLYDMSEDEQLDDESRIVDAVRSLNLKPEENSDDSDFGAIEKTPLGKSNPTVIAVQKFKCVHKTGKITHLSEEYGLIDNIIYFVPSQVSSHIILKVNDEVLYTAYKAKDNESERVYKIYASKKDSWDYDSKIVSDEEQNKTEDELNGIIRCIAGRVTKRKGRDMFIDTIDMWCNLDKIRISFVPIEGDWVSVQAAVAFDKDVANFMGDIIEIRSIKPLIEKSSYGRVTLWSGIKKEGAIENTIFFTISECENGYSPSLGDQVVYDAIESDQDSFKWRALVVYRYDKTVSEKSKKNCNVNSDPVAISSCEDKNGISISPSFCSVELEINERQILCFDITNDSSLLIRMKSVSLISNINSQLVLIQQRKNKFLQPKETFKVYLKCQGKFLGLSGETCIFRFEGFAVARKIEINVIPSETMNDKLSCKLDKIINVFKREWPKQNDQKSNIVLVGPKVWQPPKFISKERKLVFALPKKLQEILYQNVKGEKKMKAIEEYAPYLKFDLCFSHYASRFHTFLYLEELELRINFQKYNLDGVCLVRDGEFFSFKVPGLVERRPSVIVGDSIILTQPWIEGNVIEHVGFIHDIREKEVLIKFHGAFHDSYDGSECNIRFVPNTFFFARCHEAVTRAEKILGKKWLFPSSVDEKPVQIDFDFINFIEDMPNIEEKQTRPSERDKIDEPVTENRTVERKLKKKSSCTWVNEDLNERQKLAVVNVLKGQGRPLPYIIFGPPGTGKTVTLVEIILQIYRLVPESRILVTTPSNSAADLICTRLIKMADIKPGQLIRLTAITKILDGHVPPHLRPYTSFHRNSDYSLSNLKGSENIRLCAMNELTGKHKITVSTCTNIGRLHFYGFRNGHFTHILVDEAGQSVEPEVLIAATFQNIDSGQVVLAGDPQQLGPVICSKIAKAYGFGESLLERFTKVFPYAKDLKSFPNTSGYDPRFITKLNVNYRTLPEILALPSLMFYNSELIPAISETCSEEASIVKKFNFMGEGRDKPAAIIFHGIIGMNYQESDSPSWFNPHEIWQVTLYLKKLYSVGLNSSEVGILTPYAKQAQKLVNLIASLNLAVPKVGTVEEYQGQENKVIILSTVRSTPGDLKIDISHHLGFVASPKRLNVSLTRAKALLIIVGNPVLLSYDPYWCTVIDYCIQNKSYTGCNLKYFKHNLQLEVKEGEEEEEEEKEEEEEEAKNE